MGTCYLIHFDTPIGGSNPRGKASHYLGYTHYLSDRLHAHATGNGSRLMAAVGRAGITWQLARTWENATHDTEKLLKRRHNNPKLCPICWANKAKKEQNHERKQ